MILDPYIVKAMSLVTPERLNEAYMRLYPLPVDWYKIDPDMGWDTESDLKHLAKWLHKARTIMPGRSLSTGKTKSYRGQVTCAMLDVLGVERPKAVRTRMCLAWAIIYSPEGQKILGHIPELDAERMKYDRGWQPSI